MSVNTNTSAPIATVTLVGERGARQWGHSKFSFEVNGTGVLNFSAENEKGAYAYGLLLEQVSVPLAYTTTIVTGTRTDFYEMNADQKARVDEIESAQRVYALNGFTDSTGTVDIAGTADLQYATGDDALSIVVNLALAAGTNTMKIVETRAGFDCDSARTYAHESETDYAGLLWSLMLFRNEVPTGLEIAYVGINGGEQIDTRFYVVANLVTDDGGEWSATRYVIDCDESAESDDDALSMESDEGYDYFADQRDETANAYSGDNYAGE